MHSVEFARALLPLGVGFERSVGRLILRHSLFCDVIGTRRRLIHVSSYTATLSLERRSKGQENFLNTPRLRYLTMFREENHIGGFPRGVEAVLLVDCLSQYLPYQECQLLRKLPRSVSLLLLSADSDLPNASIISKSEVYVTSETTWTI